MNTRKCVSAIIPTRNRPHLVPRAVCSALTQTYQNVEVIVIVDGPDAATIAALKDIHDDRLRIIELPKSVGGANSRNVGVEAAQGDWIALLDDDDEWLPDKIAIQMSRANDSEFAYPVVGSQLLAKTSQFEMVWPRRKPYEPLCEYLLTRNSWSYGDGLLSTITLLAPKNLFFKVPFRPNLKRHQDLDWVLRATKYPGAGIEFVDRPLAIWHVAEQRGSVSTHADWQTSFEWLESVRNAITPRAYAGFVATHVAPQAARQHDWKAFPILLGKMLTLGKPKSRDLLLFFGMWSVPRQLRQMVRKAER